MARNSDEPAPPEIRSLHDSHSNVLLENQPDIKLYRRRWAVLFAICVFGILGTLAGETGPILHTMLDLLELPLHQYVYIDQVFGYLPILSTVPTAWFMDRYGMRVTMYGATAFMIIKSIFSALLFSPDLAGWKQYKFMYWTFSSIAGMQTISIFYCTPLKISENWFSESERSIAWTLMITSSNIGVSIACFFLPRVVQKVEDVKPLCYVNLVTATLTTIVVFTCITKSRPPSPPSQRMIKSSAKPMPYFKSIKKMFGQRDIVIHMLHVTIFEGVYISMITVIQDILLVSGHSTIFVGDLLSINSIISLILVVGLAAHVHRVKDITLACKLASLLKSIFLVLHLATMLYPLPDWVVLISSITYVCIRSWSMPTFNNMTAHLACGIVSEATMAGFGTTLVIVAITISKVAFVSLLQKTPDGKNDYTFSIAFTSVVCIINSAAYLIFFTGKIHEKKNEEETRED